MREFIIEQKMSNSGSIYDLASDTHHRLLKIRGNTAFFIVFPAYYSLAVRQFKTEHAAVAEYHKLIKKGYSFKVFNADGEPQVLAGDSFYTDRYEEPLIEDWADRHRPTVKRHKYAKSRETRYGR